MPDNYILYCILQIHLPIPDKYDLYCILQTNQFPIETTFRIRILIWFKVVPHICKDTLKNNLCRRTPCMTECAPFTLTWLVIQLCETSTPSFAAVIRCSGKSSTFQWKFKSRAKWRKIVPLASPSRSSSIEYWVLPGGLDVLYCRKLYDNIVFFSIGCWLGVLIVLHCRMFYGCI